MTKTKKIVIFGAGGQGRETAFYIERINQIKPTYDLLGFVDENTDVHGKNLNDIPILGGIDWLETESSSQSIGCVLALGLPEVKKKVEAKIKYLNINFERIIDPSSIIDYRTSELGKDIIIGPGTIIAPNTVIKDHVLINYNSVISHESTVGKYASVYGNVSVSGNVHIHEGAFIGTGASIIQNRTIGRWSIVGAGAVVTTDIPENTVFAGVPARKIKDNIVK